MQSISISDMYFFVKKFAVYFIFSSTCSKSKHQNFLSPSKVVIMIRVITLLKLRTLKLIEVLVVVVTTIVVSKSQFWCCFSF